MPEISSTTPTAARESRARSRARRLGLMVSKDRHPSSYGEPGYMLVDANSNGVVAGGRPIEYCLDLDDVEEYLNRSAG